jgi:hypothetical protein
VAVARILATVAGAALVLGTLSSLSRTLVVPRGLRSRLTQLVERATHRLFAGIADRLDRYESKDRLLAAEGPAVLLGLLGVWLLLLLTGFSLLLWGTVPALTLPGAAREAGSSLLTLGFATTATPAATVIDFFAAATGLVVVALQIAYLPTLYSAFNRREVLVTMLDTRAGAPAWGPEILARHHAVGLVDTLPAFYASWEAWAADVAESHTNYPVLTTFRSPKALHSWVIGLLSVLDSAALFLALSPDRAPTEARLCLRQGFTAMRDIADTLGIAYDPDPRFEQGISLTYEEFAEGLTRLGRGTNGAFPVERSPEEAWREFVGWRVNYESIAYALAERTDAVPGRWSGERARMGERIETVTPVNRTPDNPDGARPAKPPANVLRRR